MKLYHEVVMKLTYAEYIKGYIDQQPAAAPIFTAEIGKALEKQFQLPPAKAAAAVSVAMKRIMDRKAIQTLRFYQKGIYYKTTATPFGEVRIDKEKLIAHKYLNPDQGYDTGAGLLYKLGLTTQLPNERLIATNAARECVRRDEKLNVSVCPPKTKITADNKAYLQTLDALEQMDHAPIDADEPYRLLAAHIQDHKLKYDVLLSLADQFYPQRTILQLTHTARNGEIQVGNGKHSGGTGHFPLFMLYYRRYSGRSVRGDSAQKL